MILSPVWSYLVTGTRLLLTLAYELMRSEVNHLQRNLVEYSSNTNIYTESRSTVYEKSFYMDESNQC